MSEGREPETSSRGWAALTVVVSALVVAEAWQKFGSYQDDAYIFLRYADNFVRGAGLVYNLGERVEGFTSPLWQLLVIACAALHLDMLHAIGVMGTVATVGTLLVSVRDARRCGPPGAFGAIAPLALATYVHFVVWAVSGLETSLFTFLLWAALSSHRVAIHERRTPGVGTGVLLALASLARPEGGVAVLVLVADAGLRALRSREAGPRRANPWRAMAALLGPAALAGVVLLAARWVYYHDSLPNTFYAKIGGTRHHVAMGAVYLGRFMRDSPLVWCVAGLLLPGAARRAPALGAAAAIVAVWSLNVLRVGGDYLEYHRFMVPLAPLLFALGAQGVHEIHRFAADRIADRFPPARLRGAVPAAAASLALATVVAVQHEPIQFRAEHGFPGVLANVRLGRLLGSGLPPGWTIGLPHIGAVGYYSRRRIVDFLGLVDRGLAHRPTTVDPDAKLSWRESGHDHFDVDWSFAQKPDVVAFLRAFGSEPFEDISEVPCELRVESRVLERLAASREYVLRNVEVDTHVYGAVFVRAAREAELDRR